MKYLSQREEQVLDLLVEGVRAKEIANRLNISPKTVDTYIASAAKKRGVAREVMVVAEAYQRGFEAGMKHIASGMADALIGRNEAA